MSVDGKRECERAASVGGKHEMAAGDGECERAASVDGDGECESDLWTMDPTTQVLACRVLGRGDGDVGVMVMWE